MLNMKWKYAKKAVSLNNTVQCSRRFTDDNFSQNFTYRISLYSLKKMKASKKVCDPEHSHENGTHKILVGNPK